MGTIAEKLDYVLDTKQLFKDRLNSLGAGITESTTFRNYLTWLDDFYGNVSNKTDIAENGIVGETSQETNILPSDFTQVDYIESSGTQYINTLFFPNQDTSVEMVLETLSLSSGNHSFFGARQSSTINHYGVTLGGANGNLVYDGYGQHSNNTNFTVSENTKYKIYKNKNNLYINDALIFSDTYTSFTPNTGMYLFAMNQTSSVTFLSSIRVYSCKVYDGDTLVRDFIPCYRISSSAVGLYDLVNDEFYTNRGEGTFTYGSVVSLPNPDYPMPIINRSGTLNYKVSGKNLLNINDTYYTRRTSYTTVSINGSSISITNTYSSANGWLWFNIPVKVGEQITISYGNMVETRENINNQVRYIFSNTAYTEWADELANNSTLMSREDKYATTTSTEQYLILVLRTGNGTIGYTISNIQVEYGTKTDYEPYITPQTFPLTLGNIELCKIENYKDYIKVSTGKNLFKGATEQGSFSTTTGDTLSSTTRLRSTEFSNVNESTQYTLSGSASSAIQAIVYEYTNGTYNQVISSSWTTMPYTFTTSAGTNQIKVVIRFSGNGTITSSDVRNIQIETGSTVSSCEPYGEGVFYLTKNIGKVVLNGSESYTLNKDKAYVIQLLSPTISDMLNNTPNVKINYFRYENGDPTDSTNYSYFWIYEKRLVIDIVKSIASTSAGFKTWLSTHNTIVYYALATPTTTEITEEDYPTLYSQLKAIQDYLVQYKISNEFILGYDSPEIEY